VTRTLVRISNKDIVAARRILAAMKAKSTTPKAELVLIANSLPGDMIEV
jgi:hypothetical protein